MTYKYLIYFSDEVDGVGYNIGEENIKKVLYILFSDLDLVDYIIDTSKKVITVSSYKRLEKSLLEVRRENCILKYKSGRTLRPYIMAELS